MDRVEWLDRHLRQPAHSLRRALRQAQAALRVQAGLGRHLHRHHGEIKIGLDFGKDMRQQCVAILDRLIP